MAEEISFRKLPVVIQAIQWTGSNLYQVIAFTDGPPDIRSTHAGMQWDEYCDLVARDGLKIYTLEGKMSADVGDWIIKGVKGEHYPCKPDVFDLTYEPASAPGCPSCGLKTTNNPHPQAGDPSIAFEVGAVYECIPCMSKSRHEWSRRALDAEQELRNTRAQQPSLVGEAVAWRRRDGVMGCKRFMTQKCYDAQSPQMKGNYEPFYCAHCVSGKSSPEAKFTLGDRVRKTKGSQWHGTVVGTYSTALTPEGYAVESSSELGSVHIYPASALEACE